jgi:hypothetical protein
MSSSYEKNHEKMLAIADAATDRRVKVTWQETRNGDVLTLSDVGAELAIFEDLTMVISAVGHTADEFRASVASVERLLGFIPKDPP